MCLYDDSKNSIYYFVREEAREKARKFFGTSKFRKILVVLQLGSRYRDECVKIAKKNRIDKILEFEDILEFVIQNVEENKNYTNDMFLQTIRLLLAYGFLKKEDLK